jgi:hypothetical protein
MAKFEIGENVLLNGKTYQIIGTIKRSFLLERDGKKYKATAKMMGKIQDQNKNGIGVGQKKRTKRPDKFYMNQRLEWNRIFGTSKLPETEKEHMEWFSRLSNELSPENLHCDGEISRTAARKKYYALKAEWKEVEKSLGRKVDEEDVWAWERKNRNW